MTLADLLERASDILWAELEDSSVEGERLG